MVGLSERKRLGGGKTSSKGSTYYWSGMSNGHHAIGISSRLQPSAVGVTPVDESFSSTTLESSLQQAR